MMTTYSRTQQWPNWCYGVLGLAALVTLAVPLLLIRSLDAVAIVVTAGVLLILVLVLGASRMTVTVDMAGVDVTFAFGWPRRYVATERVTEVSVVRNRWFFGWGIRFVPHGWLWNVWGLDAAELRLDSGRVFRIGTAEPNELAAAIDRQRQGRADNTVPGG
jgi:hypothetical protein